MSKGKLYSSNDELVAEVEYTMQDESPRNWWGELILTEYKRVSDGPGYVIELEDKRRGRCNLKKRVNRAVSSLPPRYIYRFAGSSPLK